MPPDGEMVVTLGSSFRMRTRRGGDEPVACAFAIPFKFDQAVKKVAKTILAKISVNLARHRRQSDIKRESSDATSTMNPTNEAVHFAVTLR